MQGIAAPTIGNPGLRRIFTAGHKGILKPDSLQNRLEQGNRTVPKKGPGTKSNGRKSAPIRLLLGSAHGRIPYVLGLDLWLIWLPGSPGGVFR